MKINPFSFNFRGRNSREDFGLMANSYDFLLPSKRERKQQIPFRHGSFDYGAKWYNERILRLRCVWDAVRLKKMTRSDIREVAYWLSQKGQIKLDIEPDKFYVGEIYDGNELVSHYDYAKEDIETGNIETIAGNFDLNFICEPFAYKDLASCPIKTGVNKINYVGTAETPCVIILRNNNAFSASTVQIVVNRRKT